MDRLSKSPELNEVTNWRFEISQGIDSYPLKQFWAMGIVDADTGYIASIKLSKSIGAADILEYLNHVSAEFGIPFRMIVNVPTEAIALVFEWARSYGVGVSIAPESRYMTSLVWH